MRAIRLIDDNTKIIAFGEVGDGGLGDFDADIYEEVEIESIDGLTFEPPLPWGQLLFERFKALEPSKQAQAWPIIKQALDLFDLGLVEASQAVLSGLSDELKPEFQGLL